MKNKWLEIDKEGLCKSLGQKDKVFLLTEMVSNAWDENITKVEVTLSCPDENNHSWLRVTDNSPTGWADLSHSHTMFAESVKKGKSEKRGRFNAGEKDVLALAIEAKLTTVKGQVLFNEDGTRTEGTETREVGSEFAGRFHLTLDEYEHIVNQAKRLIPPKGIVTLFNGQDIPYRKPIGSFTATLPIPLADKEGVMRNTERKTRVNLYERLPGEVAMIYEMGIPIVELGDDKWHVNVMQKVPLSRDRDNVNPSYLSKVRVGVLNAKFDELNEDDAGATWISEAAGNTKSSDAAVIHIKNLRFGEKAVTRDVRDIGSAKEAVSKGFVVIEGGSMSGAEWARLKAVKKADGSALVPTSREVAPTDIDVNLDKVVAPSDWTPTMQGYARFVGRIAPRLINRAVTVQYIDDDDEGIQGCFKWKEGEMTVNLACHDVASPTDNYELLIHELAHNTLHNNDHLHKIFYETVTELGAKLAILALTEPRLFDIGADGFDFTDVQPIWDAAASREMYCEGVAAHAAKASTARKSRVSG
jgi:hypothetical protein